MPTAVSPSRGERKKRVEKEREEEEREEEERKEEEGGGGREEEQEEVEEGREVECECKCACRSAHVWIELAWLFVNVVLNKPRSTNLNWFICCPPRPAMVVLCSERFGWFFLNQENKQLRQHTRTPQKKME